MVTIRQKRIPTLTKKTVVGQRAVTIGYVMSGTGILLLIAIFYTTFAVSQGQRASYFLPSLIVFFQRLYHPLSATTVTTR